jgi:hypothetical protein
MPNEAADLPQKIVDAALGLKRVTVDGTTVEARDVDEIIAAQKHLAGQTAAEAAHFGLRFAKLQPPGAG